MKEKFAEIMNERGLYGDDPEEVIRSVYDLICYNSDKMKEKYPYAAREIDELEKAAYRIFELLDDVN